VSGTVVREDNQDPAHASNGDRVLLRGSGGTTIVDVGAGGAFEFLNVRPGTYQIVVGPMVTMDPVTVVVSDKDVGSVRVIVPNIVTVRGNVAVEGGGPYPRFQMTFTPVDSRQTNVPPATVMVTTTFTAQLRPGDYRISSNGLPTGYSLKSVTMGTADALAQSLKVVSGDSEPIAVILGVSSPPPWVKVSGRLQGSNSMSTPPTSITMSGTAAGEVLTTPVRSDGSFEFPKVLPGSYTAQPIPLTAVSTPVALSVGNVDVTNFEIRIPEPKEVRGRIIIRGNVPMPRVVLSLAPAGGSVAGARAINVPANPQQDGTFTVALPEGERQITIVTGTLPAGYSLASFTYGTTDLLKNPLRVAAADDAELRVTFDATAVTPVNVSGRVAGLLTTRGVRVVLMSQVLPSVEASVNPDGSFAFSNVIPGNYTARLSLSGLSTAALISVGNRDVTDAVITYPRDFVVTGHVIVEGGTASDRPEVLLEAKNAAGVSRVSTIVNASVIMLNIKDGEYTISVRSVSPGYQVKSITYGTTDLLKERLKIDGPVTWEIIVRLVPG